MLWQIDFLARRHKPTKNMHSCKREEETEKTQTTLPSGAQNEDFARIQVNK
jgi:hypothetical protein